jgi:hypothetical protein
MTKIPTPPQELIAWASDQGYWYRGATGTWHDGPHPGSAEVDAAAEFAAASHKGVYNSSRTA